MIALTLPLKRWMTHRRAMRYLAAGLAALAMISAFATYGVMTHTDYPLEQSDTNRVIWMISISAALLFLLCAVIARQVLGIWRALKRESPHSRLQKRVAKAFTLVAVVPGIIVSLFAGYLFYFGVQSWFDTKVSTALEESVAVARAYMNEHVQAIRADALAMAGDINREAPFLARNEALFNQFLSSQVSVRSLTEAVVFQQDRLLAQSRFAFSFAFEKLPAEAVKLADAGEVAILHEVGDEKVRALVKLDRLLNAYLLVGRFVDATVLDHMKRTSGAASDYALMQERIHGLQWRFFIMFVLVTLLLLVLSLWYGMVFSTSLAKPINRLFNAAERVRAGDLSARVEFRDRGDEITALAKAFNRMTEQLQSQRAELMEVNRQLDVRRRFTETVLAGVSAGVIALDADQRITLFNRSAVKLLGEALENTEGQYLGDAVPEMTSLLQISRKTPDKALDEDVEVARDGQHLTFHVRVSPEIIAGEAEGYVVPKARALHGGYIVTFDDITQLLAAQRRSAWADVARRIAHEIKNPLTPIQLSAERLMRKYGRLMEGKDRENFVKYTDTISRHVGDIRDMVEEFAAFARMPAPTFAPASVKSLVQAAVFSEECRSETAEFTLNVPEDITLICDAGQVSRALGNVIKNALDILEAEGTKQPALAVTALREGDWLRITVEDNGPGFPKDLLPRLTEPYVTTRPKGTGLGLAIVKKILEDHHGELILENRKEGGARVIMRLPLGGAHG